MENKLKVSLQEARLIHEHTKTGLDSPISKREFIVLFVALPDTLNEKVHNHALSLGYKLKWKSSSVNEYEKPKHLG